MPLLRHNAAIAIVSVLPFVSATFVGLRMYARYLRRIKYGWDDWLLVVATLCSIGLIAPSVLDIKMWNIGFHIYELNILTQDMEPNMESWYRTLLSIYLLNTPILPLAKASIILLLLKVGKIMTIVRRYLYVVFAFNALACVIPWCLFIFICPPTSGNLWMSTTFGGLRCFGRNEQGYLLLFVNCATLVTDLLVFPVPFFIMRELMNTDRRARVTISLTFASSVFVTAMSAVKIYVTYRDRIPMLSLPDWTYSIEFIYSHGESNVGIIVACLPLLRPLFTRSTDTSQGSNTACSARSGSYASATRISSLSKPRGDGGHIDRGRIPSLTFHDEYLLKEPVAVLTAPSTDLEKQDHDMTSEQLYDPADDTFSGNEATSPTPLLSPPEEAYLKT